MKETRRTEVVEYIRIFNLIYVGRFNMFALQIAILVLSWQLALHNKRAEKKKGTEILVIIRDSLLTKI